VTGRFGTSLLVGIIGSVVAILLGGPPVILGFAASAVIFDLLMSANHHKIRIATYNLTIAAIATMVSAYFAGVLIGVFFTPNQTLQWALTTWGGFHVVGGIITVAITLPIILALEKANVRKIKGDN
jgi:NADH:ubiquinone oxidoreductase subunit 5 (subunit L)/multisubunit Na+/H+ antiporter MnhA subunit